LNKHVQSVVIWGKCMYIYIHIPTHVYIKVSSLKVVLIGIHGLFGACSRVGDPTMHCPIYCTDLTLEGLKMTQESRNM
jgi:hypothetical protein